MMPVAAYTMNNDRIEYRLKYPVSSRARGVHRRGLHAPYISTEFINSHGRRPRGDWGTVPQNLRWGDGPCIRPPNILRSSVVGCAREHEQSRKRCYEGIIFWNRGFPREERVINDISQGKDMENLRKYRENLKKPWLKKGRAWKRKRFPKKPHSEILVCEIFSVPPNSAL